MDRRRELTIQPSREPFLLWCSRRASVISTVCLNMFGLAQRVHIPSLRTAQHAALAHLAATTPSKLDSREGCLHRWRVLLENFKLNSGSMSKDMRCPMRKDLQQLSCFDSCWGLSVFAESTVVFVSQNLLKLSYKQLCRDMELTLMNVSAEQAFSLIELHEHLNSPHFPGSFGTIENPSVVSAILNDGVVGCGGGIGEAEHVPQQFHCKEGFLDRCGECEQIFMLACVMYGLLGNAWIDLVDLDINAGERLRSRITSWSEAGERLRSRVTSWSGKTCTAGTDSALRRVCPGSGNFGGSHGCHELPHSVVGAVQDRMDETVVSVEDADVEAETILDFDGSVVVQSMLLVEGQADSMETTVSSRPEHGGLFVLL